MTNLLFLIVGNFITCAYSKNFTVIELLRKPLIFKGFRQDNLFVVRMPKGLPWEETVFSIENIFISKLKDLALKKGLKEADKNNNFVVIDSKSLETLIGLEDPELFNNCDLIYSPWYRFVSEPFRIGEIKMFNDHVMGVFAYALKSKHIDVELKNNSPKEREVSLAQEFSGFDRVVVQGEDCIDKLVLKGKNSESELDIVEKRLKIHRSHDSLIFNALEEVESDKLQNIIIVKSNNTVELIYEK